MIKKLCIENFKSIKNAEIEFPQSVAIVGKNSAGKTNLLQAIGMIRNLVLDSNLNIEQSRISLIPNELFNFGEESSSEFSLKIIVSQGDSIDYELSFSVEMDDNGPIPTLIVSKEKLIKIDVSVNSNEVIYTRKMSTFLQNGKDPFPLAIDQSKLAIVVYKHKETDEVKNIFSNILIPDFEDLYNLNSIGVSGKEKNSTTSSKLADILVNLRRNQPEEYNDFLQIMRKFMPNFKSLSQLPTNTSQSDPSKNQYLVVLDEEYLSASLSMRSISAGDIRTLYLIASSLNMDDHSSLVVEEIENGIHPKRIIDLMEQIETIAKVKKLQIIFTTHSPLVINATSPTKVILIQKKEKIGTTFTMIGKSEQITEIKAFLEADGVLSDFLFSK